MGNKMAIKNFKVIWKTPINVENVKREIGDTFKADNKDREIMNLLKNKYIQEVE